MDLPQGELSPADITALQSLHTRGFAVCVFTPEEVGDALQEEIEDSMCAAGWDKIREPVPEWVTL